MNPGFTREILETTLIICFNWPESRNPLSVPVLAGLTDLFSDRVALANTERVIFTGMGDAFASGADLKEIAAVTAETVREFSLRGQALMNLIATARPATIAAINGFCFGGALDLALACDHRIASPKAVFSHPGTSLGIITGWGGTQRLPRLIGEANALEMFFTAGRVGATEALRIGLVDMITDDVVSAARAWDS